MNSVTKTIGQAILQIGNRLRYGPGAAEGDFTSLMLPRETDPRSQRSGLSKSSPAIECMFGGCTCASVAAPKSHRDYP